MKNFLRLVKQLFKDNSLSFILLISLALNDILVRMFCSLSIFEAPSLFFNLFYWFCIFFILYACNTKLKIILSIIFALIDTLYSFAQTMHYSFFKSFFSLKKLTIINELKGVSDEILTKFSPKYLLFIIPFFFVLFSIRKIKYSYKTKLKKIEP